MNIRPIYVELATRLAAIENCERKLDAQADDTNTAEWLDKHADVISVLISLGPGGSGIDQGFVIDYDKTRRDRIVLTTAFHHMNESGFYDGWTDHQIVITPSLEFGTHMRVTGRDRNRIKDYLGEMFDHWMNLKVKVTYPEDNVFPKVEVMS